MKERKKTLVACKVKKGAGGKNREVGGEGGEVERTLPRTPRWVAVNDRGRVIGESHPNAVLTDHEVDLLLELRAEGLSYDRLAGIFEVSKSCVARICRGDHRSQIAARFRRARDR